MSYRDELWKLREEQRVRDFQERTKAAQGHNCACGSDAVTVCSTCHQPVCARHTPEPGHPFCTWCLDWGQLVQNRLEDVPIGTSITTRQYKIDQNGKCIGTATVVPDGYFVRLYDGRTFEAASRKELHRQLAQLEEIL